MPLNCTLKTVHFILCEFYFNTKKQECNKTLHWQSIICWVIMTKLVIAWHACCLAPSVVQGRPYLADCRIFPPPSTDFASDTFPAQYSRKSLSEKRKIRLGARMTFSNIPPQPHFICQRIPAILQSRIHSFHSGLWPSLTIPLCMLILVLVSSSWKANLQHIPRGFNVECSLEGHLWGSEGEKQAWTEGKWKCGARQWGCSWAIESSGAGMRPWSYPEMRQRPCILAGNNHCIWAASWQELWPWTWKGYLHRWGQLWAVSSQHSGEISALVLKEGCGWQGTAEVGQFQLSAKFIHRYEWP